MTDEELRDPATERLAFVTRVLAIFGESDQHEQLFWRVNDELHLLATCNDLFWWATADCEEITPENLPVLEQTLADLQALPDREIVDGTAAVKPDFPLLYLSELFAARSRKTRPQQPCYKTMSPEIAALFNACGPERDPMDEG